MDKNDVHPVINKWLTCWETGDIDALPIVDSFCHTSPFGTIKGKQRYLEIVAKNKSDFLGNTLTVINQITEANQVCVQFEQKNANTGLEMVVCEWYTLQGDQIKAIRSFYNVGDAQIKG
ncbi:nuclear transport factor 2 family protein [Alteromonas ponticola]|uniref:Nuclear transport factor 2 family protein n=1 Tax=Alteromonas ponticola TaxID=2720613 RepID=A0ABX1R1J9_9ALTE|nr:nuclear transport factor 2 family protein [Alteromonas ponticola]NMH60335.1 nuclear transport factor 2 family protein [Alteromonas ponticola]